MADNEKLLQAIDALRFENAQYHDENYLKQGKQVANSEVTVKLMAELVDEFRQGRADDKLDAEERRRDAAKDQGSGGPKPPERSNRDDTDVDFGLSGILATVAGIGAAVAGFAVGLVQGVSNIFKLATAAFRTRLTAIFAPVTRFVDAITDVFGKRGSSQFLKGNTYKTLGNLTKYFRGFADIIKSVETRFARIGTQITQFSRTVRSYAGMLTNVVKDFGKLKLNQIGAAFSRFTQGIVNFQRSVVKYMTFGENRALTGLLEKITKPVKNFINGLRGVGESTSKIAKTMKSFFGAFKVIGRFVAFPLTVVMGLIDSFKGARDNMEGRVGAFDKILSGAIGAIAGLIKGLILVPIDLLKSGISWVAKKLGFENFANLLDSFSFADSFMEFTSRLTDGFIYTFRNAIDSIMKPFEDGVDLGSIFEFVVTLPYKIVTSLLDLTKSAVGSLLGLFGATDAEEALGSFSFTDMFDSLIQFVKELPTRLANALLSFFEDPIGAIKDGLQIAGNFASMAGAKIKSLLVGLLPDPDSLVANLVPDALYEWANEPPPAPPEPVVADVPATETQNPISRSEEPQEIRGVDEDGFEYIERRRPASMDRPASTAIAGTRDIYGEEFIDPVTGESRRQKVFEADPMIAAKLQKDNDEFFAEMDRLEAAKNTRGQDLDQMSRTNAQSASSGMNVVVSAPNQTSTTTNNSNTAAIIDQNLPTVDTNDRSWGLGGSFG